MTGSSSQSTRSGTPSLRTPAQALKRKRTMLEESSTYSLADFITTSSAKGEIQVEEVDSDGKFIRLINKSDKVFVFIQHFLF
jgi:lamin B